MFLTRLIYHSCANFEVEDRTVSEELGRILSAGLAHNPSLGLTGVLAVDGDRFIQVLEGPRHAVSSTFRRIAADERHHDVELVMCGEVEQRCFYDWAVAVLREDALPGCEPRQPDYDHITANGLLERARRIHETGLIARRQSAGVNITGTG
ncbi:MAG: BLUF domain-containing protein [Oceanicaulis sp.]|uniref:BLUF domain-containing protein n=1 Tax=Glycocaulis sp. TaxID=1969725 RepID=UPI0025BB10F4|nr:BLUF domain-containing protein [Glycocaulis sp.]MCC5981897.1 BLUF domain-containing protein [Oceanicaulis sp.]MCH8522047.1 BLUF domain-containing protein [Glycocaulis sp.]